MADVNGPVIIRHNPVNYFVKPGEHSHNLRRRDHRKMRRQTPAMGSHIVVCNRTLRNRILRLCPVGSVRLSGVRELGF